MLSFKRQAAVQKKEDILIENTLIFVLTLFKIRYIYSSLIQDNPFPDKYTSQLSDTCALTRELYTR